MQPIRSLWESLAFAPRRVRAALRASNTSGLVWELTAAGLGESLRALTASHQNPSAIYRIHARNTPHKTALIWRERSLSYGELGRRIEALARGLVRRGLGRRQSVVSLMRNRPEHIELQNAVARASGGAVAVSWRSTPAELSFVLKNSEARFVFFEHELWPTVDQVARELDFPRDRLIAIGGEVPSVTRYEDVLTDAPATLAEDEESAAVVTYTSGTTGKPKGAVRRFPREVFVSTLEFIAQTPMRTDDVHLTVCPLYHMTAYGFLTFTHVLGGTVVIADEFKPETFLSLVERHRVTSTALVPTMLHRLIALGEPEIARHRTRSLRAIYCGGSALTGQLATRAMDALGDVLYNFYGATETGLVTLATPADLRAAPGTIGRALPHNEIVLVDDSGQTVRPGEVGELYVKNGQLVVGYHGDEAATRSSMLGDRFSVGDLARVDRQGRYFIEGRKRDMIITGGVNVYPTEIEAAIEEHPSVFEAAVVGVADAEWGERVKAFVVAKPGVSIDEADLKTYMRGKVASPKVPREYAFVSSLPRNATGKVLKRELAVL